MKTSDIVVMPDRPDGAHVRPVLERHLAFCREITPPEHAFVLDLTGLMDSNISFFTATSADRVVGMGALKRLPDGSAEVKSMHVLAEARGTGAGRAILDSLIELAVSWKCAKVYLETGTMPEFEPARALYRSAGFLPCPPFGAYKASGHNSFMCRDLSGMSGTVPESSDGA